MQLVRPGVDMFDPMKSLSIGPDQVFEKFGVPPDKVVDVQSLAGDSTDNVPGAPGIGLKTAALLIQEYGDLDTLLARASEIKQPKRREALEANADLIRISRQLVTLKDDTPLETGLDDLLITPPDPDKLLKFLTDMEFRSITRRVAERLKVAVPVQESPKTDEAPQDDETRLPFDHAAYVAIRDRATLDQWIARIADVGHVAIDTETTSLDEMRAELVGISLCVDAGQAAYIPLGHRQGGGDLFGSSALIEGQLDMEETLKSLKPVLEDPAILKIGQNMKYDWKIFARHGIRITPFDDTLLLSYAMHAGLHNHGMDELSERYLGHQPIPIKSLLGSGKSQITFDRVGIDDAVKYAAEDADITLRLWQMFKPRLHKARVTTVYETLERPLVPVLADMEMAGITVDKSVLSRMSNAFAQKLAQLEDEIGDIAGEKFNVGSPKQLGEILFDRLQIPGGEKGKTGAYGTGADVLEDITTLEDSHPTGARLAARVLDWRQIAKLKSTYTDALQEAINPDTGRVHTSYSIAGPTPGGWPRPTRTCRTFPSAPKKAAGYGGLCGPDRQAAGIAGLQPDRAAHPGPHRRYPGPATGVQGRHRHSRHDSVRDVQRAAGPDDQRRAPQGQGHQLRRHLRHFRLWPGAQPADSARGSPGLHRPLFRAFPGIKEYMSETVKFAQANGFVQTLFGRKIHTPEINAKGPGQGFAKRAAINAPIQGTAADVIRRAMIRMPAAIAHLPARMLLQVHDELLFEVEEDRADDLAKAAKDVMEDANLPAVALKVPLTVESGKGRTWAEAH